MSTVRRSRLTALLVVATNRRDLTVHFFEFLDHYLKGAPAPEWLTDGVPFLEKDKPEKVAGTIGRR